MPQNICFVYVETNGLHRTTENISKKNMFKFARPVCLNYIIGYKKGDEFVEIKNERTIFKPEYMAIPDEIAEIHGITTEKATSKGTDGATILNKFRADIKNVQVIISHNLPFHLKALQIECIRNCISPDFSTYILIDTINFNHKLNYPKLKDLSKFLINKKYQDKKSKFNIQIIKKCFLHLYESYEKSIIEST
jgi:DNA polymerase III epsilon subunit-like protein